MPIHNFDADLTGGPVDPNVVPGALKNMPGIEQLDDIGAYTVESLGDFRTGYSAYVREDVPVAFYDLDRSLKHYFSDIPVPSKSGFRYMQVRISGGKRSTLTWSQNTKDGKPILPIASIKSAGDYELNYEKYGLPYFCMRTKFLNSSKSKVAQVFRPMPVLVNYTLNVETEHKRDMGYIKTHILRRFNPYAEFVMCDGRISGTVQLYNKGASDTTDEEVAFDSDEKVTWEFRFQADAWLSLPEVVTPVVRGNVVVVREGCNSTKFNLPNF